MIRQDGVLSYSSAYRCGGVALPGTDLHVRVEARLPLSPLSIESPLNLLPSPQYSSVLAFIMSDFEDDEMDIDAPPVKDSVTFSSNNTNSKGKRSAANLPVEAEDNLPW